MTSHRQCVFLKGGIEWCYRSADTLLADFEQQNTLYLSQAIKHNLSANCISQNQAKHHLGKEFDAIVFDAYDDFNADSFGAIVGTIRAGGVLLILLSDTISDSLWLQRFDNIAKQFSLQNDFFHYLYPYSELPTLQIPEKKSQLNNSLPTTDQVTAIDAIKRVVFGHRRRPLVLSSDRGRGKSAALGMAAAELLMQGKHSILVTAPSLSTVDTVFAHAGRLLPEARASKGLIESGTAYIRFIAPDALLEADETADVVLVDEAAAIPAAMLALLLDKFSRIVFASTLHGYEGTGLGFTIRFKQTLDDVTPKWRSVHMTQPIRWPDDDALEAFSFKALLLNAEPAPNTFISGCELEQLKFERINRQNLVSHESCLSELFGLMVLAHYRTRPSDLQMLLDRDDIAVYVMRINSHIVASAWCVTEGELAMDLADAIYAGERRLKGHLLPQSLLAHAGIVHAGGLSYQRIIRLAVHPEVQGRGLGQLFVRQLVAEATRADIDIIGASFASSVELIHFWSHCGFSPMRLGLHYDNVSGSHAMMMLRPLSSRGQNLISQGVQIFRQQWPFLIQHHFQHVSVELVVLICQLLGRVDSHLSTEQHHELTAFAFRQRSFDVCQFSLVNAMSLWVTQSIFLTLSKKQQSLCVMLLLQRLTVSDVSKRLGFSGKSQLMIALRDAVAILLQASSLNDFITSGD